MFLLLFLNDWICSSWVLLHIIWFLYFQPYLMSTHKKYILKMFSWTFRSLKLMKINGLDLWDGMSSLNGNGEKPFWLLTSREEFCLELGTNLFKGSTRALPNQTKTIPMERIFFWYVVQPQYLLSIKKTLANMNY